MIPLAPFASPDKQTIQNLFDGIAKRYDRINHVLSFRLDEVWRKRAVRLILEGREEAVLDIGVGTGKFLEEFLKQKSWKRAVGIDFAHEMLGRAGRRLSDRARLIQADLHDLPFEEGAFDVAAAAFTLRSVKDRTRFFTEIRRVLRPDGKAAFLCLTRPASWAGRMIYAPYLKFYLPWVGRLLSKSPCAYRFLSDSIQAFPSPREIARELESLGFRETSLFPFTLGLSTLIVSRR